MDAVDALGVIALTIEHPDLAEQGPGYSIPSVAPKLAVKPAVPESVQFEGW